MTDDTVPVVVGPRAFPFRGTTYRPGRVLYVPADTAERMEAANPPYGRRLDSGDLDERGHVDPWSAFTPDARKTLQNADVGPLQYAGERQEDGRVGVANVRDWLAAREAQNG